MGFSLRIKDLRIFASSKSLTMTEGEFVLLCEKVARVSS
jgi:hypothetical protein